MRNTLMTSNHTCYSRGRQNNAECDGEDIGAALCNGERMMRSLLDLQRKQKRDRETTWAAGSLAVRVWDST